MIAAILGIVRFKVVNRFVQEGQEMSRIFPGPEVPWWPLTVIGILMCAVVGTLMLVDGIFGTL